ncbi:hypothetical protein SFRURICE_016586 [Spodoptera frugiperda]|nr:hypothetical protein SFRURICE_016586 [Spodoptera frugiperda]
MGLIPQLVKVGVQYTAALRAVICTSVCPFGDKRRSCQKSSFVLSVMSRLTSYYKGSHHSGEQLVHLFVYNISDWPKQT